MPRAWSDSIAAFVVKSFGLGSGVQCEAMQHAATVVGFSVAF